jgi:hypothetical protein
MRPFILAAASALALATTALSANAGALTGAGLQSAADELGMIQQVARVCRETCSAGICRKRCVIEPEVGLRFRDRDSWRFRDREGFRSRGEFRDRDDRRGPDVEFRVR